MTKLIDSKNLVTEKHKEKIFFGAYSGFQRYDNPTYSFAVNLEERQRNAFWNPGEVSMVNDSQKFPDLPEHVQEIQIVIWLFQTLMDSGQNKGLEEVLAGLCTNSEVEAMFKTWGYFELIHSISYSHIIRGIFPDATKIFDKIKDYPEIQKRIDKEIELYDKVKKLISNFDEFLEIRDNIILKFKEYVSNNKITSKEELQLALDFSNIVSSEFELVINDIDVEEKKKIVLELLVSVYALEGIKFYVSFLVTYLISNTYGKTIGSTRIIKLINFDEDMHTSMGNALLNTLKTSGSEGFSNLMKSEWYSDLIKRTLMECYQDEMDFAKYLMTFGDLPSFTEKNVDKFLKFYIDKRSTELGEEKIFNQEKTDTVQWFESFKDLNKDNAALQESDLSVYSIGIMKNDLPEGSFSLEEFGL